MEANRCYWTTSQMSGQIHPFKVKHVMTSRGLIFCIKKLDIRQQVDPEECHLSIAWQQSPREIIILPGFSVDFQCVSWLVPFCGILRVKVQIFKSMRPDHCYTFLYFLLICLSLPRIPSLEFS